MRHVVAAVSVILLSVLLALQWMPEAQAKKTKDPAVAIKKRASKAAKKALKPFLREIRADAKSAAKDLRAIAKAVRTGRPLPAKFGTVAARPGDVSSEELRGIADLGDFLIYAQQDQLEHVAAAAKRAVREAPAVDDYLANNATARDCAIGAGGLCDQITGLLQEECDDASDAIAVAVNELIDALRDGGADITALSFPPGAIAPFGPDSNATVAEFAPSFVYVFGFDEQFSGTVRIPVDHVTGNATTGLRVECYDANGLLAGTGEVDVEIGSPLAGFSCDVAAPGTYRLALVSDCDKCCPPIAQCWLTLSGTTASPGGSGLLDIDESFAKYTIAGVAAADPILNLVSIDYGELGLERFSVYFNDAANGTRVLAVTLEWRAPPGTVPSGQTIVTTPQSETDPYVDFVHEAPLSPGTFYVVTTGPGKVADGTVEITFDRDVADPLAGNPTARIQGNVTVRSLDMQERTIAFDIGVHRSDVLRR